MFLLNNYKHFLLILVFGLVFTYPVSAQNQPTNELVEDSLDFEEEDLEIDLEANSEVFESPDDPFANEDTEEIDTTFSEGDDMFDIIGDENVNSPGFFETLLQPARFTLKHEHSYKTKEPTQTVNKRSSVRLEYSKFFGTYFFLQLDVKLNGFHESDHRQKRKRKIFYMSQASKKPICSPV